MTELEYTAIKTKLANGIPLRKAAPIPAQREAYRRLRRKKGEDPKSEVLREAIQAAHENITTAPVAVPTNVPSQVLEIDPVLETIPIPNLQHTVINVREMLELTKRAVMRQLQRNPSASWVKLSLQICEKEIPEWNSHNAKANKDEYEDILRTVLQTDCKFEIQGAINEQPQSDHPTE